MGNSLSVQGKKGKGSQKGVVVTSPKGGKAEKDTSLEHGQLMRISSMFSVYYWQLLSRSSDQLLIQRAGWAVVDCAEAAGLLTLSRVPATCVAVGQCHIPTDYWRGQAMCTRNVTARDFLKTCGPIKMFWKGRRKPRRAQATRAV
eukprot:3823595-Rhodomonas_salina.2